MTDYDDLFATTTPEDSVFADKAALDPLAEPDEVVSRDAQQRQLATLLNGITEGYLPTTVSIHGPPGTGKTLTTRRVCQAFAQRHDDVAVEYVNLKECRSLFAAANELHLELTGEKKGSYEGLDGIFEGIWDALSAYPAWTVVILDEIDHIQHDSNYDPSDFFYRLLRGEGKLKREIQLSAWLISNELLEVDLRVDSRVESAMSDDEVFFPPYDQATLAEVVAPQLEQAFRDGALPPAVRKYGVQRAADRWGDARKTLRLFRHAGETASDRGLEAVTEGCIDANIQTTDKAATVEKLTQLPFSHFLVMLGITSRSRRRSGEIVQPVTTGHITTFVQDEDFPDQHRLGTRAVREIVTDLETMGLVETWIESRGNEGRVKQIETTFDPEWVREAQQAFIDRYQPQGDRSGDSAE
jgi:cell division control protein 6